MKILNLYAGIGGNRKLWGDEHEVTAVEYKPEIAKVYQDLFPADQVIVGDAHQYLLEHYNEFDFIWASPPCPTHSRARYGLGFHGGKVKGVYPDMTLYQEIIFLKHHFKGKYCVENVQAYYKPLIEPQILGRHWYWANFEIPKIEVAKGGVSRVDNKNPKYSRSPVKIFNVADWEKRYDYDLSKYKIANKRLLLRNCVEPEIGLHIISQVLSH